MTSIQHKIFIIGQIIALHSDKKLQLWNISKRFLHSFVLSGSEF
ncbi:hypothetical protein HMPREF1325_2409 [Treponema socranskii subsp. socranskii VPI DR56BR1116 = ATCC 35536]|uniref:Uncharacterized protein n=1 Tax=Treponema socranskii subsp. socranskii VPI DR56BR1116 = ATCC 35536 TaxID=1125725 RepID=U1GU95_TRESO|nr:hypothetical protein HMPREF1325_2409 [Treponema socranskii subsp. socranskii VPI DR56BR1116 = ATCC 35536]